MSELKPTPFALLIRTLAVLSIALLLGHTAAAQNLFAPVARVDSAVVTEYEVQQRQRFLQLLNAPGSDRESVIDALIDDRLRIAETSLLGVELPAEAQAQGLAEFAARANLTTEEFVTALGQAGVDRETFRDFVSTQLIWRDLIRARYSSRVSITDDDIDRALAQSQSGSGVRVLLSEIIIPAPPQNAARVNALADQISQTRSTAEFSSFARRYSATASRGRGGQLPWTPLEQLPPLCSP
ncbi:peptidylprolyl isomerase [Sulfitobacter aestuariivivens]|uniref:peptidylprolyl isomerase n=1 Tax=Sulfitobacter aestuariivivens TaxID=2766981 RepID=UPI003621A192